MAAPSTKELAVILRETLAPKQADALAEILSAIVLDLQVVTAKLDADATVTDTNYAAQLTVRT